MILKTKIKALDPKSYSLVRIAQSEWNQCKIRCSISRKQHKDTQLKNPAHDTDLRVILTTEQREELCPMIWNLLLVTSHRTSRVITATYVLSLASLN